MSRTGRVYAGVGVWVEREGKILVGFRLGDHGGNSWSPPGGTVEPGEVPKQTAARELKEETGLVATRFESFGFTSAVHPYASWLTIWLKALDAKGEV